MSIEIYRCYPFSITGDEPDPNSHYFSVVVSDSRAEYVWPSGKDSTGLDEARIEMLIQMLGKPKNMEEWARLALTNIGSYTYVGHVDGPMFEYGNSPEDFADAVSDERGVLNEIALEKDRNHQNISAAEARFKDLNP
jgi:hypothetical protein